jgi:serine/threonine protein kinase
LLHNELIPELPFGLRVKMAYQTAKGMHFLHSSGIVHRDLKSLNLLLNSKWAVKVSDFGLTKFKEEMKHAVANSAAMLQGSVHWTAREILDEAGGVDHVRADVYSFGIVMWELLTREQPYYGLRYAQHATAHTRHRTHVIAHTIPHTPTHPRNEIPTSWATAVLRRWPWP